MGVAGLRKEFSEALGGGLGFRKRHWLGSERGQGRQFRCGAGEIRPGFRVILNPAHQERPVATILGRVFDHLQDERPVGHGGDGVIFEQHAIVADGQRRPWHAG